jgi:hypothetical protein
MENRGFTQNSSLCITSGKSDQFSLTFGLEREVWCRFFCVSYWPLQRLLHSSWPTEGPGGHMGQAWNKQAQTISICENYASARNLQVQSSVTLRCFCNRPRQPITRCTCCVRNMYTWRMQEDGTRYTHVRTSPLRLSLRSRCHRGKSSRYPL